MGNKQAALASPEPHVAVVAVDDEAAPPSKHRRWSRRKCVGPAAAASGATRRFAALPFRKKGPVPLPLSQPSPSESAPPLSEPTPPPSELAPVISEPMPHLSEPAPLLPESAPPVSESSPKLSEPAPLVSESAPLVSESAPLVSELAPLVSESVPLVSESAPLVSESAPPLPTHFGDCVVKFSDTAVAPLEPEKSLAESYDDIPYIDEDDDVELDAGSAVPDAAGPAAEMVDEAEAHFFTEDLRWSLTLLGAYPCLAEGEDFPDWAPSAASNKLKWLPHQRLISLFGILRIGKGSRS